MCFRVCIERFGFLNENSGEETWKKGNTLSQNTPRKQKWNREFFLLVGWHAELRKTNTKDRTGDVGERILKITSEWHKSFFVFLVVLLTEYVYVWVSHMFNIELIFSQHKFYISQNTVILLPSPWSVQGIKKFMKNFTVMLCQLFFKPASYWDEGFLLLQVKFLTGN